MKQNLILFLSICYFPDVLRIIQPFKLLHAITPINISWTTNVSSHSQTTSKAWERQREKLAMSLSKCDLYVDEWAPHRPKYGYLCRLPSPTRSAKTEESEPSTPATARSPPCMENMQRDEGEEETMTKKKKESASKKAKKWLAKLNPCLTMQKGGWAGGGEVEEKFRA